MTTQICSQTATKAYLELLYAMGHSAKKLGKTYDMINATLTVTDPTQNFVYMTKQHWVWCLYEGSERLDPAFENPGHAYRFRPVWRRKLQKEGGYFCYTYGEVFRRCLPGVLARLRSKSTREAIIPMWISDYLDKKAFDRTPCTIALHFMVRDGQLFLTVYMRTNDVVNLLPYDLWHHMMLQCYVAAKLGLGLGHYTHHVGNLYYQKKRVETGILGRIKGELQANLDNECWTEFDPETVSADMARHYILVDNARTGSSLGALEAVEEINSPWIRDWTKILLCADCRLRGYLVDTKLESPEFNYIQQLGYHL